MTEAFQAATTAMLATVVLLHTMGAARVPLRVLLGAVAAFRPSGKATEPSTRPTGRRKAAAVRPRPRRERAPKPRGRPKARR